jgi:hypothetical protein
MKQILLDEQTLATGLDAATVPTPDTPVAIVAETPDQLTARHGFELQKSYDDLGPLVLAVMESANGTAFTLEHHEHDPLGGTTVAFFNDDLSAGRLREVLDELAVAPEQVVWRYFDQVDTRDSRGRRIAAGILAIAALLGLKSAPRGRAPSR